MEKPTSKTELKATLGEITVLKEKAKTSIVIEALDGLYEKVSQRLKDIENSEIQKKAPKPSANHNEVANAKQVENKDTSNQSIVYKPITSFAWDQDGYNGKKVFIYVTLKGVGTVKDKVTCDFDSESFDLKVMGLNGVNYRMIKKPLYKEIIVDECKFKVKDNRIVITLRKTEGEYGTDNWTELTEQKSSKKKKATSDNPAAGIMDMMKKMYDEGDDKMKKTIGEAMLKSRREQGMR